MTSSRDQRSVPLQDGLYQVSTAYLCAGFTIRDRRVEFCAPILRAKFDYWRTIAVRINLC